MASFDISVDGACKGKPEDVANMKRRLSALLEGADTNDLDAMRELFGDELEEIEGLDDPEDDDQRQDAFSGLDYEWQNADPENLQFSGYGDKRDPGGCVERFLSAVNRVFPRIQFHFISYCYISWGHYTIFLEGEEDVEDYNWDEGDGGEEKKDSYVNWRLAYREAWLLPDDAPAEIRAAAQKAEADAEANFFVLLAEPYEDEDEDDDAEEESDERVTADQPAEDSAFQSRDNWPHGSSMNTFEMSYQGPPEQVRRMFCDICNRDPSGRGDAEIDDLMRAGVDFPGGCGREFSRMLSRFHPSISIQDETEWGPSRGVFRFDADWMDGDFGRFLFNGGFYLAGRYPEIDFTVRFEDIQWNDGWEVFKYHNGRLVEQYFKREDYTHWAFTAVRYSGAEDAANRLRADIIQDGEPDLYHLMGQHLALYRFYPRTYFDPPCEIMDSRINGGEFSFYSFNISWRNAAEQTQTEYLLDRLAACYPDLDFATETLQGYNPANPDEEQAYILRREYSGGSKVKEERLTGMEHIKPFAGAHQYGGGTYYRYRGEGIPSDGAQSGRSYSDWLSAVQENPWTLYYVPQALRTEEICAAAFAGNEKTLRYAPRIIQTEKFFLAAVQQIGSALEYVPEVLRTPEICLAAVQQNGRALYYVPEALRMPEICLAAVQQSGFALEYVPEALKTAELCLEAVKESGGALEYVPEALKTAELYLAAVTEVGYMLKYVPEVLKTAELCLEAVKESGGALKYVPEELKTAELCLAAVKSDADALPYVPEALRTPELCLAAVKQNGKMLKYVPKKLKAQIAEAAGIDYDEDEDSKIQSEEDALRLVREAPADFPQIPERYRTREICLIAVTSFGSVCAYIPTALQSEEFFIEAVNMNTNGKALKYVPDEFRTLNVCLASVKKFPETLEFVPEALRLAVAEAKARRKRGGSGITKPARKASGRKASAGKPASKAKSGKSVSKASAGKGTRRFLYQDGKTSKFWEISVSGTFYAVLYGTTGTPGTREGRRFDSPADCAQAAEKAIAEKLKKGYTEEA
jgi:predicted DNA-binding WGR domain protein